MLPLPGMQAPRIAGILCVLAYAHSPSTTPSPACAAALPLACTSLLFWGMQDLDTAVRAPLLLSHHPCHTARRRVWQE